MTITVSPTQISLDRLILFTQPNGKIMRDTDFGTITFTAYTNTGDDIVYCRMYPAGESYQGGQETIFSNWDSGITFRVNSNTSSSIMGEFKDQFGGEAITHIPKGKTTRMFMEYETVPVIEDGVQVGTKEVPQGERPMTDSEFSSAKAKNPEIVKPTVTNGTANVPPNQEILGFTADSTNRLDAEFTIEVGYYENTEDPEVDPIRIHYETRHISVHNDLDSLLNWINNYMDTYSPFVPPNPEG